MLGKYGRSTEWLTIQQDSSRISQAAPLRELTESNVEWRGVERGGEGERGREREGARGSTMPPRLIMELEQIQRSLWKQAL